MTPELEALERLLVNAKARQRTLSYRCEMARLFLHQCECELEVDSQARADLEAEIAKLKEGKK